MGKNGRVVLETVVFIVIMALAAKVTIDVMQSDNGPLSILVVLIFGMIAGLPFAIQTYCKQKVRKDK